MTQKKSLYEEELNNSNYEFQFKIKSSVDPKKIYDLGAKKIGSIIQEDKYFVQKLKHVSESDELIRIRKEGGEDFLFTYFKNNNLKDEDNYEYGSIRKYKSVVKPIDENELLLLKKSYSDVVSVNKKRTMFLLGSILINVDEVEKLGNFIEFKVQSEKDSKLIFDLVSKLGLNKKDVIRKSYFELSLVNLRPIQRLALRVHEKLGGFSFGISSAVLTTLGIIVGLNSATDSFIAVIGGIASVAVADSLSDSMGMYAEKMSQRGTSKSMAFKSSLNVFLGKLIFTLSFIIPFLLFDMNTAMIISVIWGAFLLSFVNAQIAFIQETSILKQISTNLSFAVVIIFVSHIVGLIIVSLL
ncbi:MAG: CYTH domain-containing protein [Candidatus Woesearchaeota archaeon]